MDGICISKFQWKKASTFKVPDDMDSCIPVFRAVAVEDGGKMSNGESYVRLGANCEVVQAANKEIVWDTVHPGSYVRQD